MCPPLPFCQDRVAQQSSTRFRVPRSGLRVTPILLRVIMLYLFFILVFLLPIFEYFILKFILE